MTLTSLDYFASLVRQDDSIPLFESALTLGQDFYPEMDFAEQEVELDLLAQKLRQRLPSDASQIQKLRMLNHFFFQEMAFAGNVNNYYDPDNSYIHRVIATRRGIPISLAVVYIELAQQVGLDMKGVSFPGHFLMKLSVQSGEIVLDPMNGSSLSREELEERLEPYLERQHEQDFGDELPLGAYLRAAHPREILARMLRNLKAIFMESQRWQQVLDVQERLVILLPEEITEKRDRGLARANLGLPQAALEDLEAYLALRPHADDAQNLREMLPDLREALRKPN
ncbi:MULTISPECIES: SirB1 family protein [unclassified Herbaspirillum]|uniref:SirB1 family protein n=1 Tax=unclassified Herbaspirillum TaxID=2624150 RepID=UPI00115028EA|nr:MULTISPECIES: tetratricopeptide repeat protein [unclassified Herbaspirillum]MBB5391778.1 regulator of sirC expression with transglutaminase-like and TPR domain [Herbaspirillum sp. SJZ102]TQK02978.1 regulator of sirC expression with transglutaminase-like and TPR domain [Herbaspirillum sp. SJZ130]TQK06634.1 regulator of sirC expression with transglutaminase-like and TPR domain [Herbaspirillum sp. SJZ106]TWC71151.1 regulator of sirC expression with transglutaminase-like and TPR domain [Herbaspi